MTKKIITPATPMIAITPNMMPAIAPLLSELPSSSSLLSKIIIILIHTVHHVNRLECETSDSLLYKA